MHISSDATVEQRLLAALTMLRIRRGDSRELETLYRAFVLPGLRPREGRDDDLSQLIGTTVGEALYIAFHLQEAIPNGGDICEFGVAQGATSRFLAREIAHTDRTLWLFDSFEGLPKPSKEDELIDDIFRLGSMAAYAGTMRSPREEVESRLRAIAFPPHRVRVKPGWIDKTITEEPLPERVAFAYVDFDFHDPIRLALEWLDGRMPAGGAIVVDDYGFFSKGAQTAVDAFVAARPARWRFAMSHPAAGHFCVLTRT
ncbi:MAG: TylF/MycF/NovP-related O-methyltransferase [Phycisphaerae bacterium]|nr:TylF/MycF/NovP-related O-methyltransferase [Phycisphaerae bacterium]